MTKGTTDSGRQNSDQKQGDLVAHQYCHPGNVYIFLLICSGMVVVRDE